MQVGRQRDQLQQQVDSGAAASQAEAALLHGELQEQQESRERLSAQLQKLEASCKTLKACSQLLLCLVS